MGLEKGLNLSAVLTFDLVAVIYGLKNKQFVSKSYSKIRMLLLCIRTIPHNKRGENKSIYHWQGQKS